MSAVEVSSTGWANAGKLVLACEATVAVLTSATLLTLLPFRTVTRIAHFNESAPLDNADHWTAPPAADDIALRRLGAYVERAARAIRRDRPCLTAALAANALLRRRRRATTLVLGVARRGEGSLAAHAWLLHDGQCITGRRGGDGFAPVCRLDSRLASR